MQYLNEWSNKQLQLYINTRAVSVNEIKGNTEKRMRTQTGKIKINKERILCVCKAQQQRPKRCNPLGVQYSLSKSMRAALLSVIHIIIITEDY